SGYRRSFERGRARVSGPRQHRRGSAHHARHADCSARPEQRASSRRRVMLKKTYPYYLANEPVAANTDLEVTDKFSGEVATRVALADAKAIDTAIARAAEAMPAMRAFAPFKRQAVLEHCVKRFRERYDELAMALCIEAGKPINDSRGEVTRLIDTFKVA